MFAIGRTADGPVIFADVCQIDLFQFTVSVWTSPEMEIVLERQDFEIMDLASDAWYYLKGLSRD